MRGTTDRTEINGPCAQEPSNLLEVDFELADDACECIAMHPKILGSPAEVTGMPHEDSNDVALLELTNSILIGHFQDPHLLDDLA